MSAERLREAAALMRSRAEAATPGPWNLDNGFVTHMNGHGERMYVSECYSDAPGVADAEHITPWHPAVALAVADWLEMAADHVDPAVALDGGCLDCEQDGALAVANAYLGATS